MFESIAAIDIGSSSIKLIKVKTGLKDFEVISVKSELIDTSKEIHADAVRESLGNLLSEEDISKCTIITNFPMEKSIIRNISFPFNDVEKIADAIPFEAEGSIPFKIDDMVIDFQSVKSHKPDEGRVIVAAAHKDMMLDHLKIFNEFGLNPFFMGMESNSLFECYRYFNRIDDETVIQVDIGNSKTIINFIKKNSLVLTRSISIGIEQIYESISEINRCSYDEAINIFDGLYLDVSNLENNINREFYKSVNITKPVLKKIFNSANEIAIELSEQIYLSIKSYNQEFKDDNFSRILISGGGSNIIGLSGIISKEMELPVVSLPFLEKYKENYIQTQFPVAFGTLISYLKNRKNSINFLKGEFLPDVAGETKKIYYIARFFAVMTVISLFVYLISSIIISSKNSTRFNEILSSKFANYFNIRTPVSDPVAEATKIVKKEKANLDSVEALINSSSSVLDLINEVSSAFPKDRSFLLKELMINEKIITIEASASGTRLVDEFKENLLKGNRYESVDISVKASRRDEVSFNVNIKLKIEK